MDLKQITLLNTHINNLSLSEVLQYIDVCIERKKYIHLVSLNVDQIIKIENNKKFKQIVDEADLVITDGTPVMWISSLFGNPIVEKMPGPYLAEKILSHSSKMGYKVFLLGAKEGIAAKAAELMTKKHTGLQVVGTYSPPFGFEKEEKEIKYINQLLNKSNADILIVGLSAPKQEIFVYNNKEKYKIPVSISLGAAIDFMSGNIKRAPNWINKYGLEWFYRFILEPKRLFRRYFIEDIKIFILIFKYRSQILYDKK